MTPIWVAALVAGASIAATYAFCVRPAMRGGRPCGRAVAHQGGIDAEVQAETGRQLSQLQRELRELRAGRNSRG